MSKYYNLDRAFKRDQWNLLILDVIALAENPPEGCVPADILEEVGHDHIWKDTDITKVQSVLIQICPNNEFTELTSPQIWVTTLIDELETAIEIGWCECESADPIITTHGPYGSQIVNALPEAKERQGPSILCAGQTGWFQEWVGPLVPCISNTALGAQIVAAVHEAEQAKADYISAVNDCNAISKEMIRLQDATDEDASRAKAAADKWIAAGCNGPEPPGSCSTYCYDFTIAAEYAELMQDRVDEEFAKFQIEYEKIPVYETLCDSKAAEASAYSAALAVRFVGIDKNWFAEFIGAGILSYNWAWKKWYNPYRDSYVPERPGFAVNWTLAGDPRQGSLGIFLTSPSGIPIPKIKWDQLLHGFALPYCITQGWWLCECIILPCECGEPCSSVNHWGPEEWWWYQGDCEIGLPGPEGKPEDELSWTFTLEARPYSGRYHYDYTDKQDQFYLDHTADWYTNHPSFNRADYDCC